MIRRHRDDEQGFTLVEIMITVAIIGIIMVPLLAWTLMVFERSDETRPQEEAAELAALSRVFIRDVQAAESADIFGTATLCGDSATTPNPLRLGEMLSLRAEKPVALELVTHEVGADAIEGATIRVVTQYVLVEERRPDLTHSGTLFRRRCEFAPDAAPTAAPVKITDQRLIGNLDTVQTASDGSIQAVSVLDYATTSCPIDGSAATTTSSTTSTSVPAALPICEVVELKIRPREREATTVRATRRPDDEPSADQRPRPIIVCSPACTAFRKSDTNGNKSATIALDGSRSRNATAYRWNFGDGTPASTDPTPGNHTFVCNSSLVGIWDPAKLECRFTVTLTVVGGDPVRAARATAVIVVKDAVPNIVYNVSEELPTPPATSCPTPTGDLTSAVQVFRTDTVKFSAAGSSDPDGTLTFAWNFGDPLSGSANTATGETAFHTYNRYIAGSSATLTVTSQDGPPKVITIPVKVSNCPPVASFTTSGLLPGSTSKIEFCSPPVDCNSQDEKDKRTFTFDGGFNAVPGQYERSADFDGSPTPTADVNQSRTGRGDVKTYKWSVLYRLNANATPREMPLMTRTGPSGTEPGILTTRSIGNGDTGSTGKVEITFPNLAGTYEVVLRVTDYEGLEDTLSTRLTTNAPPRAIIDVAAGGAPATKPYLVSKPSVPGSPDRFEFSGVRSFDPDAAEATDLSYEWTVTPKGSSTGTSLLGQTIAPDLTPGRYIVVLTVRDADQARSPRVDGRIFSGRPAAITTVEVKINPPPDVVMPTQLSPPLNNLVERNVDFTFSTTGTWGDGSPMARQARARDRLIDSTDKIVLYTWRITDPDGAVFEESNTTGAMSHKFTRTGTAQALLTVKDNEGAIGTGAMTFYVVNAAPTIHMSLAPGNVGGTGQAFTLVPQVVDPDGPGELIQCEWTIHRLSGSTWITDPDQSTRTRSTANCSSQQFTWNTPGDYRVTMQAWDGEGKPSTQPSVNLLYVKYSPIIRFKASNLAPPLNEEWSDSGNVLVVPDLASVNIVAIGTPAGDYSRDDSRNTPSGIRMVKYEWGDGSQPTYDSGGAFQHQFRRTNMGNLGLGQYEVTVTVENLAGITASAKIRVMVNNPPELKLTWDNQPIATGSTVVANCLPTAARAAYPAPDWIQSCLVGSSLAKRLSADQSIDHDAGPLANEDRILSNPALWPGNPKPRVCWWFGPNPPANCAAAMANRPYSNIWTNPDLYANLSSIQYAGQTVVLNVFVADGGGAGTQSTVNLYFNAQPRNVAITGTMNLGWNFASSEAQVGTSAVDPPAPAPRPPDADMIYEWVFTLSDGTVRTSNTKIPAVTFPKPTLPVPQTGTVTLRVTDPYGFSDTATPRSFTVSNATPVARIVPTDLTALAGWIRNPADGPRISYTQSGTGNFPTFTTRFDGSSSYDPDNSGPLTYTWTWVRNETTSPVPPAPTPAAGVGSMFPNPALLPPINLAATAGYATSTWKVTLNVSDGTATGTATLLVRFNRPPLAAATTNLCARKYAEDLVTPLAFAPGEITDDNDISTHSAPARPATLTWNWGDGTPPQVQVTDGLPVTNMTHTYTTYNGGPSNKYPVSVVATDRDGATTTFNCPNQVRINQLPVVFPQATPKVVTGATGSVTVNADTGTDYARDPDNFTGTGSLAARGLADAAPNLPVWKLFEGGTTARDSGTLRSTAAPGLVATFPAGSFSTIGATYYAQLEVSEGTFDTARPGGRPLIVTRIPIRRNRPPVSCVNINPGGPDTDLYFFSGTPKMMNGDCSTDADSATAQYPTGIQYYYWRFVDHLGNELANTFPADPSTSPTKWFTLRGMIPSNAFGEIQLTVVDADGASHTSVAPLSLTSPNPIPRITTTATGTPPFVVRPARIPLSGATSFDDDGSITDYEWRIQDLNVVGEPFIDLDPGAAFSETYSSTSPTFSPDLPPGRYRANLRVRDNAGQWSLVADATLEFRVQAAPVAVIRTNPAFVVSGGRNVIRFQGGGEVQRVTFYGDNSSDADGTGAQPWSQLTYLWEVTNAAGDLLTTSTSKPDLGEIDFIGFGTNHVKLTTVDPDGNTATAEVDVILNDLPIIELTANPTSQIVGNGAASFTFDPHVGEVGGTRDPDGSIISARWDFYKPGPGVDPVLDHTVNIPPGPLQPIVWNLGTGAPQGRYFVDLTVNDNAGGSTTKRLSVKMNTRPTPALQPGAFNLTWNASFDLDGSASTDPDSGTEAIPSGIGEYKWEFFSSANPTTPIKTVTSSNPTAAVSISRAEVPGAGASLSGTVRLTVTDLDGAPSSPVTIAQRAFTLSNAAPVAVIVADPPVVVAVPPFSVMFSHSQSSDPDGSITNYRWQIWKAGVVAPVYDSGDIADVDQTVSRTFAQTGVYTVRLTVTDDDGATAYVEQTIRANTPPVAGIGNTAPMTARVNTNYVLDSSPSSDAADNADDGGGGVVGWNWTIRDPNGNTTFQNTQSPTVTFNTVGVWTVQLSVTDTDGAESTVVGPYDVTVTP